MASAWRHVPKKIEYIAPAWLAGRVRAVPSHRLELGQFPTPLQKWGVPDFPAQDINLWIKRDDLTGMLVSGNKIRKLEFLLADALDKGCDSVVTIGGVQSNHCRATACGARMCGLDTTLVLRVDDAHTDPGLAGNLLLERITGCDVRLVTKKQYAARGQYELVDEAARQLSEQGRRPYKVCVGGSDAVGLFGYVHMVDELRTQAATADVPVSDIVCAIGSGGTAEGIALGVALSGWDVKVHCFNACDDAAYFYGHMNSVFADAGVEGVRAEDVCNIIEGYKGVAYGVATDEELAVAARTAAATGILVDPVYTGKALMGLIDVAKTHPGTFKGKDVVFVHTGGLFGSFAKLEQLGGLVTPSQPLYPNE